MSFYFAFAFLLILFVACVYLLCKVFSCVNPGNEKKLKLMGPLALFWPGTLHKSGYLYLLSLVVCIVLFLLIFANFPEAQ